MEFCIANTEDKEPRDTSIGLIAGYLCALSTAMEDGIDLGLDDLDADFGSGGSGGKRPTESAWDSDDELLNDDSFGTTKRFKADPPEDEDEFDEEALLGDSDDEGETTQNTSQESQSSQEDTSQSQEDHSFAGPVDPGEISINVSQESDFYGSEVEGQYEESAQYEDVIDISIGDTEGLDDLEVDTEYTTGSQQSQYRTQPQTTTQPTPVTTVQSEELASSHEEQSTETEAHTEHEEEENPSESESEEEEEEDEEEDSRRGRFKSERVETSDRASTAPSKIILSKVNKPNREIPDTLEVSEDVQKQIDEFEQQKMAGRKGRGFRGGRGGRGSMPRPQGQGFRPRPLLQGQLGPRPLMSQPRYGPRGGGYGPRGPPGPRGPGPLLRSPGPGQLAPRKVLINPHFKGTVQARPEAPLRWDRDTMHQHQPYQPPPHEGQHQPPPPRGPHQHPPPGGQPRPQGGQFQPPPHRGPQFQEPRPRMASPMGGHRPPSSGPPSWQGNRPQQGHNRQEQFTSGPRFEGPQQHQQHNFQPRPLLDLPPHSHPPHHSQPPPHQPSTQYPPHSQPPPRYPPHSQSQPPQHHPPHSQMSQHQAPQHFQQSNLPPHSQSYTPFSQQPSHIPTHTHNAPHQAHNAPHQSHNAPPQSHNAPLLSHNPPRPFNPAARPTGFQQRPPQLNQPRPRMQSPPPRQPSPQRYRHGNSPGNQRLPNQPPASRPQVSPNPVQREQQSPRAFPQGEQQPVAARPNLREIPQVGSLPPPQPAAMRKKKLKVQKRLGPPVSQQQLQQLTPAGPGQPAGEEDEETRKLRAKIAEQKRLREEIQRRKELRRQQLAGSRKAELMKRVAAQKAAANQEENQGGPQVQDFGAQLAQNQDFTPGPIRTQPPPAQRIPVQQQIAHPQQPQHMQARMNTPRQNLQKVQGFANRVQQVRLRMSGPQSALQPVPQVKTFQPRAQNIPQRMQLGQNRAANGQVSPMKPQQQQVQSAPPARLHVKQRLGLGRGKAGMQMSGGQQNQANAQRMVTLAGQHQPQQAVVGRGQPIRTVTSQQPVQAFDVGANGDQPHVKLRVVQGPQGGGLQQQPTQMASAPQEQLRKRIEQ
ncbi:RNA recognition motif [Branchiostoma belcheri]|nr:RNA recognition motif [Branchiostoma belcheri]